MIPHLHFSSPQLAKEHLSHDLPQQEHQHKRLNVQNLTGRERERKTLKSGSREHKQKPKNRPTRRLTYRHAGAAFGEVHDGRVELMFEQVGVGHHGAGQRHTGGGHQGCSHHCGLQALLRPKQTEQDENANLQECQDFHFFSSLHFKILCVTFSLSSRPRANKSQSGFS